MDLRPLWCSELSRLESEAPEGSGGGVAVCSVRGEWEMIPRGEWGLMAKDCALS